MSQSFFRSMMEVSRQYRGGLFALITSSPDQQKIGEKAFFASVHPISQSPSLAAFWDDFFQQLTPDQQLPATISFQGHSIFVEHLAPKPQLILLGGGHVSYFVYQLAVMLGFSVTVVDEREEFCNPSRFPKAATLCLPFDKALPQLPCDNSTYYVIVTRGHQHDYTCLSYLLAQQPCAYLGMIGSRRKVALVHQSLLEDGFTQQQIDRVFSPIGLPIHAQTPEEISVSILAQIIEIKNTRLPDSSLEDPVFDAIDKADGPVAFCMIVRKSGFYPTRCRLQNGGGSKWYNMRHHRRWKNRIRCYPDSTKPVPESRSYPSFPDLPDGQPECQRRRNDLRRQCRCFHLSCRLMFHKKIRSNDRIFLFMNFSIFCRWLFPEGLIQPQDQWLPG